MRARAPALLLLCTSAYGAASGERRQTSGVDVSDQFVAAEPEGGHEGGRESHLRGRELPVEWDGDGHFHATNWRGATNSSHTPSYPIYPPIAPPPPPQPQRLPPPPPPPKIEWDDDGHFHRFHAHERGPSSPPYPRYPAFPIYPPLSPPPPPPPPLPPTLAAVIITWGGGSGLGGGGEAGKGDGGGGGADGLPCVAPSIANQSKVLEAAAAPGRCSTPLTSPE